MVKARLRLRLKPMTAVPVSVVPLLKASCCYSRLPSRDAPRETAGPGLLDQTMLALNVAFPHGGFVLELGLAR